MAEKKFLDLLGLQKYDEKIKAHIASADAVVLSQAKAYADGLADNYDAAGTAATKVQELAEGAVKVNAEAIAKLNGDASTEGSVAKAIAGLKSDLEGQISAVDGKADKNIEDITGIKEDIGNVDELQTAAKTLSGAANELLAAIGAGGTAAAITVTAKGASDTYANVYEIAQGTTVVGTINIPKDMVVESGEVVDVDGVKNIKLVLQNVETPLYIPVGSLVDIYVAKAEAGQVQVAIDSNTREISAHIVAQSVTDTELATNAVVTAKIADANVTKAKLSAEVQASLDKADVALSEANAYTDSKDAAMNERMQVVEGLLVGNGEGTVEEKINAAKEAAISAAAQDATTKADAAEANAKGHADELNNAMDERMQAVEGKAHEHANKEELDKVQSGDVAKWNAAQTNAEATAAGALATAKSELEGKISDGDKANKDLIDDHEDRIAVLEGKVGEGFTEITEAEINAMFAQSE